MDGQELDGNSVDENVLRIRVETPFLQILVDRRQLQNDSWLVRQEDEETQRSIKQHGDHRRAPLLALFPDDHVRLHHVAAGRSDHHLAEE